MNEEPLAFYHSRRASFIIHHSAFIVTHHGDDKKTQKRKAASKAGEGRSDGRRRDGAGEARAAGDAGDGRDGLSRGAPRAAAVGRGREERARAGDLRAAVARRVGRRDVVKGSITSPDDVARAVEGAAEIYHLAGRVSRAKEDAHLMYSAARRRDARCSARRRARRASSQSCWPRRAAPSPSPKRRRRARRGLARARWTSSRAGPTTRASSIRSASRSNTSRAKGLRLVIVNPSLLLGPGDERLSSTKVVLDFLARKIMTVPSGGLSFVDARDAARAFYAAMQCGKARRALPARRGQLDVRRILRAARTADEGRARRASSSLRSSPLRARAASTRSTRTGSSPRPSSRPRSRWRTTSGTWTPRRPARELGFAPRDPQETLLDTVNYVRANFLGSGAFKNAG